MVDVFLMIVPAVMALIGITSCKWKQYRLIKRLYKVEHRLVSTKLALTTTKIAHQELTEEALFLKSVLWDVANGEAHVWIEEGELRAARKAARPTPLH